MRILILIIMVLTKNKSIIKMKKHTRLFINIMTQQLINIDVNPTSKQSCYGAFTPFVLVFVAIRRRFITLYSALSRFL